jgi:hypothetical protein
LESTGFDKKFPLRRGVNREAGSVVIVIRGSSRRKNDMIVNVFREMPYHIKPNPFQMFQQFNNFVARRTASVQKFQMFKSLP